jgi:hypothetical protein
MRKRIGSVSHYYNRIGVAVLELDAPLKMGDRLLFLGHTSEFTQPVGSMEIDHRKIQEVGAGAEVAVKVIRRVRRGDQVFRISADEEIEPSVDELQAA